MDPKPCYIAECEYQTHARLTFDQQVMDIKAHAEIVHPPGNPSTQDTRPPREAVPKPKELPRPVVEEDITEGDWKHFLVKWTRYKRSCLSNQSATFVLDQLWACCSESLENSIYKKGGSEAATDEDALLKVMKEMAVRQQNVMINVVEFLGMGQDMDEPAKHFAARLKGQAQVCDFTIPQGTTDYSNKMVMHQLIRGLVDPSIQEQVLSHAATNPNLTVEQVQAFIESKESGKRDQITLNKPGNLSRISDYRKAKQHGKQETGVGSETPRVDPAAKCGHCGRTGHGARAPEAVRKEKCPAYGKSCLACSNMHHFKEACRSKGSRKKSTGEVGRISAQEIPEELGAGTFCQIVTTTGRKGSKKVLEHHEFINEQWVRRSPEDHPTVQVTASLSEDSYTELGLNIPKGAGRKARIYSLPDTGAQPTVGGLGTLHALGGTKSDLIPVTTNLSAANYSDLGIMGAILIDLELGGRKTKQMCYICSSVNSLFLSKTACKNLGIIGDNFPNPDQTINSSNYLESVYRDEKEKEKEEKQEKERVCKPDKEGKCHCPRRSMPPSAPTDLPFKLTGSDESDSQKLKEHILRMYAESAFNRCETQPLPMVNEAPPLKLHIDPQAKPSAIYKPRPVPIYWQEEVKEQLDRDEKLGVIEKVPIGTPTEWCAPMVCVNKGNGCPRRTVDFQGLNRAAARQVHATESPFQQASAIPKNTYKTVLDCWNGYHSIPLEEADRKYTQFLTPWGAYRYKVAPQGFKASGDGYTARYDEIVKDVKNYKKTVDDTCLWENTLKENYLSTCRYITLCSERGVIFNPEKFQFGSKKVDFVGFVVDEESIRPSGKFIDAIMNFPRPKDITGVRSYFGLINQVNYTLSKSDAMLPFRNLLKPQETFTWTEELERAFVESKKLIVEAIKEGVKTFDPRTKTCLATDWSKKGIGFVLLQKRCDCPDITPVCCPQGWVTVFCGSRFLTGAESRYSPVEGETLAIAWALEKAKHFILGCPEFTVATDHKPLLKLLGDRMMEDIPNPRLLLLKEKTLRYDYRIIHIPGKEQKAPDALSRVEEETEDRNASTLRYLVSGIRMAATEQEIEESLELEKAATGPITATVSMVNMIATVSMVNTAEVCSVCSVGVPSVISLARVDAESAADPQLRELASLIARGTPEDREDWPESIREFFTAREKLYTMGNTVCYDGRLVIPVTLRKEILDILHCGHQGTSSMRTRASDTVYWPGMQREIGERRARCDSCDRVSPSLPASPPHPLPSPEYPFQMLASDYFTYEGNSYFILVDRYSNWPSVYAANGEDKGAKELTKQLRIHMATFGVPDEIASDGGPQYTSEEYKNLMKRYGIHHRVSSVAFPHSNQKAEGTVKNMKRLIRENTTAGGKLDTDKFLAAILMFRNTPDRDTNMSPAQVIFGRQVKDFLPIIPGKLKLHPEWRITMEQRETALAKRHVRRETELQRHTKAQAKLSVGDTVLVQNQEGNKPLRWDRTGTITQSKEYDQYEVKMDGSGRLSLRNRRFLCPITPFTRRESDWERETPGASESHLSPALGETPADASVPEPPTVPEAPVTLPAPVVSLPTPVAPTTTPAPVAPMPHSARAPSQCAPALPMAPCTPRRPGRQRQQPAKLKDYTLFSFTVGKINNLTSPIDSSTSPHINSSAPVSGTDPNTHPREIDSGIYRQTQQGQGLEFEP